MFSSTEEAIVEEAAAVEKEDNEESDEIRAEMSSEPPVSPEKLEEQYEEALENANLYNALKALDGLEKLPIKQYFTDSGFDFDDESKKSLSDLRKGIISFVDENIDAYIDNMFCKDVEHLTSFRNHNNRMQNMLEELGFHDYAMRVERQKNKELDNISEIKSRQELRGDCTKFIVESKMDRFTSYVAIKDFIKNKKSPLLIISDFHGLRLVFLVFVKLFEDLVCASRG